MMASLVNSGEEAVVPTAQAEKPAAHTPGTWTLGNTQRHISTPNGWTIRKHEFPNAPYEGELDDEWGVYPPLGHCGPVALVAGADNALLIAAAPELLEALRLILPLAKGYAPEGQSQTARRTCDSWISAAEDAIAKATGEAA